MNSLILFVGFLLVAVTILAAGLLVVLRRLRNAEDALDARFDENGNFIYPGRIRNWEPDTNERVVPLGAFRGYVSRDWPGEFQQPVDYELPRATPRPNTGD